MTTCLRADAGAGSNYTFLTLKERDIETGLDFFEARYYASTQGRFTSVDPLRASGKPSTPQSWNRYSYCINSPLVIVDPTGTIWGYEQVTIDGHKYLHFKWFEGNKVGKGFTAFTPAKDGTILPLKGGSAAIIYRDGRQTILPAVPGIGIRNQGQLNASVGAFDGAIPFGREMRHGLGLTFGVDENSPEYKNSSTITNGTMTGLLLFTGAGEVEEAGNAVKEAVDLAEEVGSRGLRNTAGQDAVIQLAKEAKQRGGVTEAEAQTLLEWAKEYGVKPARGPEVHPGRPYGSNPHIHVGPVNHLPVKP